MSCYNCEDTLTFALDYHYFFYFAEDWISELTFLPLCLLYESSDAIPQSMDTANEKTTLPR